MSAKKSQVTIFLIIGIVLIMAVATLIALSRYAAKRIAAQETFEVKEAAFDIQPINNFVTECLSLASKEGLELLGKQGGRIFKGQGGATIEYLEIDEGAFFLKYEGFNVTYNILKPDDFSDDEHFKNPPNYPRNTTPYGQGNTSLGQFQGNFGRNTLPKTPTSSGSDTFGFQLKTFIQNNIDACLNFSSFEEQGFNITKNNKNVTIEINENDVGFKLEYDINVKNLQTGDKTKLNDFFVRQDVRLGKIHSFVNGLIEKDIHDVSFNIRSSTDDFNVNMERNIKLEDETQTKDDIIIVTDKRASLSGKNYRYIFARKNRNPAMFYLLPDEISLEPGTTINRDFIDDYYDPPYGLKAYDPDEDYDPELGLDYMDKNYFTINPDSFTLTCDPSTSEQEFTVTVTDGALEDYQDITVRNTFAGCPII